MTHTRSVTVPSKARVWKQMHTYIHAEIYIIYSKIQEMVRKGTSETDQQNSTNVSSNYVR
jgi:hypothetical protein